MELPVVFAADVPVVLSVLNTLDANELKLLTDMLNKSLLCIIISGTTAVDEKDVSCWFRKYTAFFVLVQEAQKVKIAKMVQQHTTILLMDFFIFLICKLCRLT
jgi:hypothetical protein